MFHLHGVTGRKARGNLGPLRRAVPVSAVARVGHRPAWRAGTAVPTARTA
jgi:hypothetical protein